MDLWCQRHLGQDFDAGGAWAAQGQVDACLLSALLAEPFLQRAPPKSTGRDLFNADWLDARLAPQGAAAPLSPVDVQATLCDFTAAAAAQALQAHLPEAEHLLVCGGGALNAHLMDRLAQRLPGVQMASSGSAGLPPMQVEAAAFAWLAQAFVDGQPGNHPAVTGAAGPRLLGALYPAAVRG
jgi:anhydro-N-acetylmuramic acid kinase